MSIPVSDGKIVISSGNISPSNDNVDEDKRKKQVTNHRRAICTHLRIERVYGDLKCPFCLHYPDTGWLYQCMQDHDHPPPSDDLLDEMKGRVTTEFSSFDVLSSLEQTSSSPLLSPHERQLLVTQSNNFHKLYTPSQLLILAQQKANVALTIADTCRSLAEESPGSSYKPLGIFALGPPSPFTFCNWRCCHHCRPTSIERSWISLATAIATDFTHSSLNDTNDRPISDARFVRNLGMRQPPIRNDDRQYWDSDISSEDLARGVKSSDGGFRASIQKAFRGMLLRNSKHLRGRKRDPTTSTDGKSMIGERGSVNDNGTEWVIRDGDGPEYDFDIELWTELNEEILQVASALKLPEQEGELEELAVTATGAVLIEVENGAAFSKEPTPEHGADVITQF